MLCTQYSTYTLKFQSFDLVAQSAKYESSPWILHLSLFYSMSSRKKNFSCPPVLYIYSAKDLFLFPACLQLFQYQIFQEKKKQREKIREKYTHSSTAADYVISAPENTSVLLLSVVQKNSRNKNLLFYFGTSYSTEDMVAHTVHICTGCFWVRI